MVQVDLLGILITFTAIVGVGFVSYAAYQTAETMKAIRKVVEDVEDTTADWRQLKNTMKSGLLIGTKKLIALIGKGGETDES